MLPAELLALKKGSRKDGKPTHNEICAAVLSYLGARRIYAWKVNTGGAWLPGKGGGMQLVRFNKKGTPDIVGVMRQLGGRAIYVEVKTDKDDVSPHQEGFMNVLTREGALCVVAKGADAIPAVARALKAAGLADL